VTDQELSSAIQANQNGLPFVFSKSKTIEKTVTVAGVPKTFKVDQNAYFLNLIDWAVQLQKLDAPVMIRPLSEMNMQGSGGWCFGKPGNSPDTFVKAWSGLVRLFRAADAHKVKFLFVVGSSWDEKLMNQDLVRQTLNGLDPLSVDALGLNPYTAGSTSTLPSKSMKDLVEPWYTVFDSVPGYSSKSIAIAEMGIFNAEDSYRTTWIKEAFQFAHTESKKRIFLMTYYNSTDAGQRDFILNARPLVFKAWQEGAQRYVSTN
jgi:hypothetical protein